MNRIGQLISALCIALIFCACSTSRPDFGKVIFKATPKDSLATIRYARQIRSLNNEQFTKGSFTGREKIAIPYRLFLPVPAKADTTKLPLVVIFHGSDAIGTDNESQLGLLAKLFASTKIQQKYPAYIFAPQFPRRSSNYTLDHTRKVNIAIPQPLLGDVVKFVDSLKKTLNIDPTRIYVVGYSMGGSSAINALAKRPDLFAAAISVAGVPQFESIRLLAKIPIWIIHGTEDKENPFSGSVQFYKELNFAKKIRFWEFEGKSHSNIFNKDILNSNLPEWLFKQKNSGEFNMYR